MVDPTAHRRVVVAVLLLIMAGTKFSHARYVIVALDISMYFKTMNAHTPVKNLLSARFATRDLQEIIILRLTCVFIRVKNPTTVHIAIDNLFKLLT